MNQYVSLTNTKLYLDISGSSKDSLLALLLKQATDQVNSILSVSDLSLHRVAGEVHDARGTEIYTKDFPIVAIGTITEDGNTYTQTEAYDFEKYTLHLENYLHGGDRKATIEYAAGFHAKQWGTVTIVDYSAISGAVITVGAVTFTEASDWTAETSNAVTATKLATAINADDSYEAFAIGAVVYVMDAAHDTENDAALSTDDATNTTVSGSALGDMDFPEDIKAAVLMLVAQKLNGRKQAGVKSYSIGQKSVTFGDKSDFQTFKSLLKPHLAIRPRII